MSHINQSEMNELILTQIGLAKFGELIEMSVRKVIAENSSSKEPQDERLTRRQICELYKISFPTLHKAMHEGLPFEKIGRKTVFRRQGVDEFFKNKKGGLK